MLLKEQQYLTKITRLEDLNRQEANDRQERHDRVIDALRHKHKNIIEQKVDEISNLNRLLGDANDKAERCRMELDSKTNELNKLHEQLRSFKDDTSNKYETYNKQLSLQESLAESKVSQL